MNLQEETLNNVVNSGFCKLFFFLTKKSSVNFKSLFFCGDILGALGQGGKKPECSSKLYSLESWFVNLASWLSHFEERMDWQFFSLTYPSWSFDRRQVQDSSFSYCWLRVTSCSENQIWVLHILLIYVFTHTWRYI